MSGKVWDVLDGQLTPPPNKKLSNAREKRSGQGGCFGVPHRAAPFGNIFFFSESGQKPHEKQAKNANNLLSK